MSDDTSHQSEDLKSEEKPKLGLGRVMLTVLSAAIGVQNRKNHEKDFQQSSPVPYIIAGVIFTVLFLVTLILVVKWVLAE